MSSQHPKPDEGLDESSSTAASNLSITTVSSSSRPFVELPGFVQARINLVTMAITLPPEG
jgi:hypothetical protein